MYTSANQKAVSLNLHRYTAAPVPYPRDTPEPMNARRRQGWHFSQRISTLFYSQNTLNPKP
jgi:hypothetical protein